MPEKVQKRVFPLFVWFMLDSISPTLPTEKLFYFIIPYGWYQVLAYVPEAEAYKRLVEFERRLDATLLRKQLDVQESKQLKTARVRAAPSADLRLSPTGRLCVCVLCAWLT